MKSIFWVAIAFLITGCRSVNNPEREKGGKDGYEDRIVWSKSIEGVEIGDYSITVIQKFGKPSSIGFGDFRGYIWEYCEGIFAGINVFISEDSTVGLGYQILGVAAHTPYNGTTKEMIGIGTPREEAVGVFGPSNYSNAFFDTWLFEESVWIIEYDTTSTISSISFVRNRL